MSDRLDTTADAMGDIASTEEIIAEARAGRPFIIVDAEDRENEGDIVIPAEFADAAAVNFMARYARGLICLALNPDRVQKLRLRPMAHSNGTRHQTAFTVSIEAREGVTTGISAHDRARTIAVAIGTDTKAEDLVTPGHVFPLQAREGGVLVRTGHTEAAVDIARLAGLDPSGVICEVMNEDGSMARLPELRLFAKRHNMKIGTIADLIAYRSRTESHVEEVFSGPFESLHGGTFTIKIFRNSLDGTEHVALTKGVISPGKPVLVRMHQVDMATDMLAHVEARQDYLASAMRTIGRQDGPGALVLVRDSNPAWLSQRLQGMHAKDAKSMAVRDYGLGAQILLALGITDMVLLTSSAIKPAALEGYGLRIVTRRPISPE